MEGIFKCGFKPESNSTYFSDKKTYDIYLEQTMPMARVIKEAEVAVAFVLRDLHDVTIDLQGAVLTFHGHILPFVLENCKNVTLRNFTIDYSRSPYTQAEIVEATTDYLAFKICPGFPCLYRDGEVIPVDEGREFDTHNDCILLQPFDAVTRAPAYGAGCMLAVVGADGEANANPALPIQRLRSELLEDNTVIWHGKFPSTYHRGQMLLFNHADRGTPGIYAANCENITVEHVRMKRVAGFAIHSYFCKDFTVRGLVLKLDEDGNELVSINADGVHMIGLSGKLIIEDCVFDNMLDDGGNFHGYFAPVSKINGSEIECSLDFPGGKSLAWHKIYRPGMTLTVYNGRTIAAKGKIMLKAVSYSEDGNRIFLTTDDDTAFMSAGDHVENREAFPEIEIRRCRTGHNRPRGFLLSSWRKTVVEDCHFYNCASAIDFTGDTDYWHESGPVEDVTIRHNIFENCGYCSSNAAITANPHFVPCAEAPHFHHNIRVEDNLFISFNDAALEMRNCEGVVYRNNRFIASEAYAQRNRSDRVVLIDCGASDIEPDKPLFSE